MRSARSNWVRGFLLMAVLGAVACNGNDPTTPAKKKSPSPTATKSTAVDTGATGETTPTPDGASATPTTGATRTPGANATATPAGVKTATPTPAATATATPTPAPTPTPVPTPTPTPVATLKPIADLTVATIAGSEFPGLQEGTGDAAAFQRPLGMAVDKDGVLYVADAQDGVILKMVVTDNQAAVTVFAGKAGAIGADDNANPKLATFNNPVGVACDADGNVFVADSGNNLIRKIAKGGGVTTFVGSGNGNHDDAGLKAKFSDPSGLLIDGSLMYVADTGNNSIRKVDMADKNLPVTTIAGSVEKGQGYLDNADSSKAQFNGPTCLGLDAAHKLYVLDAFNNRIRTVDLTQPTRNVATVAGPAADQGSTAAANGFADGAATTNVRFDFRSGGGICVTPDSIVYIADGINQRVRRLQAGQVQTLAGDGKVVNDATHEGAFKDGAASGAEFDIPYGIAISSTGRLFVSDSRNHRVRVIQ